MAEFKVDPNSLNLSGLPAISQGVANPITSPGGVGGGGLGTIRYQSVNTANPLAGAVLGGMLGLVLSRMNQQKSTPSGSGDGGGDGGNPPIDTGGGTGGGGTSDSGGGGTDTGNIGNVNTGTTGDTTTGGMTGGSTVVTTDDNGNYINTNTGEEVTPIGNNLFTDSNNNVIDQNGTQVYPNYDTGSAETFPYVPEEPVIGKDISGDTGTDISGDTGPQTGGGGNLPTDETTTPTDVITTPVDETTIPTDGITQTDTGYLKDDKGNLYDSSGNLVYQNPSYVDTTTVDQTTPTEELYTDSNGNLYDSDGNLVYDATTGDIVAPEIDVTADQDYVRQPEDPDTNFQYFKDADGNIYDMNGNLVYSPEVLDIGPQTDTGYFQDSGGNLYDAAGNLIWQNPSPVKGGSTEVPDTTNTIGTSGATGNYYQDAVGNIYDPNGNLYAYNLNGTYYVYNPDDYSWTNADTGQNIDYSGLVNDIQTAMPEYDWSDYLGLNNDSSWFTDLGNWFSDMGNDFSGWLSNLGFKEGGLAMATPMMARGGQVKGYADGDFVTADSMNQPEMMVMNSFNPTAMPTSNVTGTGSSFDFSGILGTIGDLIKKNPGISGAVSGALLTQLINQISKSGGTNQVSQGVDMSNVGKIAPRTTSFGTGPAKYVPYSQYGVPTQPANYGGLNQNLGVSGYTPPKTHYTFGNPTSAVSNLNRGKTNPIYLYDKMRGMKEGGTPEMIEGPIVEGRRDYRHGEYVQGPGDGQSDDIPAMLADGEYVIDAETVAALGNGSNKAGAKVLDEMRHAVRHHKRSAPLSSIPPKAKSPLEYMKLGAKMKGAK